MVLRLDKANRSHSAKKMPARSTSEMTISDDPGAQSLAVHTTTTPSLHICSNDDLQARLNRALSGEHLRIVDRQQSSFASSFLAEVLTCEKRSGETLKIWCKHEQVTRAAADGRGFLGYRRGIRYEAYIYRNVLQPYADTTAAFLGFDTDPASVTASLFLEYIDTKTRRLSEVQLPSAAGWIAAFHAKHLGFSPDQLEQRTREFFVLVGTQTPLFSPELMRQFPWLSDLRRNFDRWIGSLLTAEQSVIHGEYYSPNVLVNEQRVCPVDWESAASAAGEIDLAALTLDWNETVSAACERTYAAIRWPTGEPPTFRATLESARLFIRLWNLAQIDPLRPAERQLKRIRELKAHVENMNLV